MSGKRKADKQLTDRDVVVEEDEVEGQGGNWQRASLETMKGRRVVKARRRGKGEHQEEDHPSSPAEIAEEAAPPPKANDSEKKEPAATTTTTTTTPPAWPSFSFGTSSGITTPPSWPTFSFGPPKTDGKGEAGTAATAAELPSFPFGTVGTSTTSKTSDNSGGLTFPWLPAKDGEKKEDVGLIKLDTKWPSFPDLLKENEKKTEWPSFGSFPTTFSFSPSIKIGGETTETSPFKLDASIGTLSGVGTDANKTREMTSTSPSSGFGVWGRDIQPPKDPVTGIPCSPSPDSKNLKLSKLDSHTTGEEGETTEIEIRGRLYEFVKEEGKSTWKERGVGPFKVNADEANQRYRIVMRTDNALRVVLNALLYNEMTYEKLSDRQLRFTCVNTTDGQPKVGSFLLKMASPTDTDGLRQVLLRCQPKTKPLSALHGSPKKEKSVAVSDGGVTETEAVSTSDATESKGGATESEDASTTESTATESTVTTESKFQLEV